MRPRALLSFGNFFGVAHFYLVIYILAPYLATFMPSEYTGLVVSAGALATLSVLPYASAIVAKIGARRLVLVFAVLECFILLCLTVSPVHVIAIILAAFACAVSPLIAYGLDLLLEATVQTEGVTGRVRTAFLTAGNAGLVLSPIVIALLLGSGDAYGRVFFAAAASLIPLVLLFTLQPIPEGNVPRMMRTRESLRLGWSDPDIRAIFVAYYLLQFFYYSAPVYFPLYLHVVIGIPWSRLGWMLGAALLPYLLVEYPAGIVADRLLGDKELMVTGFIIAGSLIALFARVTSTTPILIIVLILAGVRVGFALIESMVEGHFFRRVTERDASLVSVFRMGRPFAAFTAPIVSSVLLALGGYSWLFIGIGFLVLIPGVISALSIKDVL